MTQAGSISRGVESVRSPLTFSIIIPTRNEAKDIAATLDCALNQTLPLREVIVIDDSDDSTSEVVRTYSNRKVKWVNGRRKGRCAARNDGIRAAQGEIVVILNADVHLPNDFLERLVPHYQAGAAYVLVEAEMANQQHVLPRYLAAVHRYQYGGDNTIEWTEGFSCCRDLAIQAGLFIETPLPLVAGEDGPFGAALGKLGPKVIDRSIVVFPVAPIDVQTFWNTYKERNDPNAHYFIYHRSLAEIVLRTIAKQIRRSLGILLLAPMLIQCIRLSRHSAGGRADMLRFIGPYLLQASALSFGEWEGLVRLWRGLKRLGRQ